ncbi:MAG: hypothetical protein ALECFALPRED_003537 [Alectoria fallacina]|uniref:Uncharacterized protein n=1 Tax=Alectoria fallacina TaxID=1903189 RepID=A0A8H3IPN3_9LECA|nr:MAG: hypothetical protein ALECFALPRED_003537 [Alectoria fallacina]
MQDELRYLQEAEGTQRADGKETETSKNSKGTPPATAGHTLKRTWSTGKDASGTGEPKHTYLTNNSSPVGRWFKESMREQPWHNISGVPELPPSKGSIVMRGETSGNSAVAGSDQRKVSEFDE